MKNLFFMFTYFTKVIQSNFHNFQNSIFVCWNFIRLGAYQKISIYCWVWYIKFLNLPPHSPLLTFYEIQFWYFKELTFNFAVINSKVIIQVCFWDFKCYISIHLLQWLKWNAIFTIVSCVSKKFDRDSYEWNTLLSVFFFILLIYILIKADTGHSK